MTTEAPVPGGHLVKWSGLTSTAHARAAVALFVGAAVLFLTVALTPPYAGDMDHYKKWARTAVVEGIHNTYNGRWPDTYSVYPPVTMFTYWAAGQVYRLTTDPAFELAPALASPFLTYLLKLPGITLHLLTGAALLWYSTRLRGPRAGLLAAAAYLLNPAALADLAYWGQPDAVYAFFLLMTAGALTIGSLPVAFAALALGAFAKPQAWSLVPFLGLAGLLLTSRQQWGRGILAGTAAAALVLAPYALGGRLEQLATLPEQISSVHPSLSANSHNFWWLQSRGLGLSIHDVAPPGEPDPVLSNRTIGLMLWGAATAFAVAGIWRSPRPPAVVEGAAFVAFGFVMLATSIHENHPFMALPLLALAATMRRELWMAFGVLTFTLLLNILLHDPLVLSSTGPEIAGRPVRHLTLVNAAANMALLLWLAWRQALQFRAPQTIRVNDTPTEALA